VLLHRVGSDLLRGVIGLIIPRSLRRLGRRIRKALSVEHFNDEVLLSHGHHAQWLAEHLSNVAGASLVWCSLDGELLTPIIRADDRGTEVIGLGCLACRRTFVPTLAGVLTDLAPSGVH
jgi:hypothetical protein